MTPLEAVAAVALLLSLLAVGLAVWAHRRLDRHERNGMGAHWSDSRVPLGALEHPKDGGVQP